MKINLSFLFIVTVFFIVCSFNKQTVCYSFAPADGNHYFITPAGNDNNNGSFQHPWQTLSKLNHIQLQPGDIVYLQANSAFQETLRLDHVNGTKDKPVIIQTYGNDNAIIDAKDSTAIIVDSCSHVIIKNIKAVGSGRKTGNVKDGVIVSNSSYISLENINVSGFQKAGLLIYDSKDCRAENITAHDNGFAGIFVTGEYGDKLHCSNIQLINCIADNNPGDPSNLSNHSGNGILAGYCTHILIDSCTATNNGWDMPRKGNGPVGIWCYEADSVMIEHCISYKNKTSAGAEDGGGFDLDGGVTNSVIQYCLSYGNEGSGFGIFQYDGASPWHDNIIRFCISENDGNVSAAHANAYIWNESHDSLQFKNLLFYNNTLYNNNGASIAYASESGHSNFFFYNNIFVANTQLLIGDYKEDTFLTNDWWSLQKGFLVDNINSFAQWANQYNQEKLNNKLRGLHTKPLFKDAGNTHVTVPAQLSSSINYQLVNSSLLNHVGIDLHKLFGLNSGTIDFNHLQIAKNGIGACLH